MQDLLIFLVFFVILGVFDFVPLIRHKQWVYLYFSIPVYAICLGLNIMMASNIQYPSISKILEGFFSTFLSVK